jgi:hypothetical protein
MFTGGLANSRIIYGITPKYTPQFEFELDALLRDCTLSYTVDLVGSF